MFNQCVQLNSGPQLSGLLPLALGCVQGWGGPPPENDGGRGPSGPTAQGAGTVGSPDVPPPAAAVADAA